MRWREVRDQGDDSGFTILEVVIALTIFALVMIGLATSTAVGLRLVGASNGRQLASQLATRELELLRQENYDDVALLTTDALSVDPGTLDDPNLDPVAQTFLVPDGPTTPEALVLSLNGVVTPRVTTETIEGFKFSIRRYVTWVDDPAIAGTQDYKRVTVAVQWTAKAVTGAPSRVVLSSLFSPGRVSF